MMKRESRIDRIAIRFDLSSAQSDPRGYLTVWGTVISADTLLAYGRGDGLDVDEWIELVPAETVFDEAAIRTLLHSPVTFHHPPEMLDASNTSRFQVGSVIDTKRVGGKLRALHQFTDERVIAAVRAGIIELSPGYSAIIDRKPGKLNGKPYHAIQRDRVYNHEAVVPEARAGHDNALDRVDALRRLRNIFRTDDLRISTIRKVDTMPTITLPNGNQEEVSDEVAAAFSQLLEQAQASSEGETDDSNPPPAGEGRPTSDEDDESEDAPPAPARTTSVTVSTDAKPVTRGELLQLLAANRVDTAKSVAEELERRDSKARKDAAEFAEVVTGAKTVLPRSYVYDGKPIATIMFDAIVAAAPGSEARAKKCRSDSARLRGMFDMAISSSEAGDAPRLKSRTDAGGSSENGESRVDAAQAKVQARRDAATKLATTNRRGGGAVLRDPKIVNFHKKQESASA